MEGKKLGCLLWVDDAVIMSNSKSEHQRILDVVNEIGKKYHLEFSEEKSQCMKIDHRISSNAIQTNTLDDWLKLEPLKLGTIKLTITDQYKYLGETLNDKMNLSNQIARVKAKTEAAYLNLLHIIGDHHIYNIQMEAAWKLLEACVAPLILYASESASYTSGEIKQLTMMYDNLIKRLLMTPVTTPREAIYLETNLLDIETLIKKRQLSNRNKVERSYSWIIKAAKNIKNKEGWMTDNDYLINEWKLDLAKLQSKKTIDNMAREFMMKQLKETSKGKSKITHLLEYRAQAIEGKRMDYLNKLSRIEVSAIFRARTRMIKVRNNYKAGLSTLQCRACRLTNETQKHVFEECPVLHSNNKESKINSNELVENDKTALKRTAWKIIRIEKRINEYQPVN